MPVPKGIWTIVGATVLILGGAKPMPRKNGVFLLDSLSETGTARPSGSPRVANAEL
jgi:hypothetical protein